MLKSRLFNLLREVKYQYNKLSISSHQSIFIVGCAHSGTTLIRKILGCHSNLYEIPYETYIFDCESPNKYKVPVSFKQWIEESKKNKKSRLIEKTPKHLFYIEKIFKYFPNAKILFMLRDGRDVACSQKARFINVINNPFLKGIKEWVKANQISTQWQYHPSIKYLKYEDLIQDLNSSLIDVMDFLEEDIENKILDYYSNLNSKGKKEEKLSTELHGEAHKKLREWQINQPIFDGRGRWKEEMSEEEKQIFKDLAGEDLIKFGYAIDHSW